MDIPLAAAERLLRRAGLRVSDAAIKEFATLLEEITADIAAEAAAAAKRAGRATVNAADITAARHKIL